MSNPTVSAVAGLAQEAFWEHIVRWYPEGDSGDFSPLATFAFDRACCEALQARLQSTEAVRPDPDFKPPQDRFGQALAAGLSAFWSTAAVSLPQLRARELPKGAGFNFSVQACLALTTWREMNQPPLSSTALPSAASSKEPPMADVRFNTAVRGAGSAFWREINTVYAGAPRREPLVEDLCLFELSLRKALSLWLGRDDPRTISRATQTRRALERASDAFWTAIREGHPEIKAPQLSEETALAFREAAQTALQRWIEANPLPDSGISDDPTLERALAQGLARLQRAVIQQYPHMTGQSMPPEAQDELVPALRGVLTRWLELNETSEPAALDT